MSKIEAGDVSGVRKTTSKRLSSWPKLTPTRSYKALESTRKHPNQSHKCDFSYNHEEKLPRPAPFASRSEKLLHVFQRWILVSDNSYRQKMYFRSHNSVFREKLRHLTENNRTIHPFSVANLWREFIVTLVWQLLFLFSPLQHSFNSTFLPEYQKDNFVGPIDILLLICNLILLLDIVWCFHLGYLLPDEKEIVLDKSKIVKRYLRTHFVFDLIATLYSLALFFTHGYKFRYYLQSIPVNFVRTRRLPNVVENIENCLHYFELSDMYVTSIISTVMALYALHWWTCLLYCLPIIRYYFTANFDGSFILSITMGMERSGISLYSQVYSVVVYHFFGLGSGCFFGNNDLERILLSLIMLSGLCVQIFVTGIFLQLMTVRNVSESKFEEVCHEMSQYMRARAMPTQLQRRVNMFLHYKFRKHFFHENIILNSLSEHLRCEVILYSSKSLIENVKMFKGESKNAIGRTISLLKHEIFLPNDMITTPDMKCTKLFFINYGTVGVYRKDGKELRHYEDGATFGGIALLIKANTDNYISNIMAIEMCSVAYLEKNDLLMIIQEYPQLINKLTAIAKHRLEVAINYKEVSDVIMVDEIIAGLRRGEILQHPQPRKY